jgi:hypothetical protein
VRLFEGSDYFSAQTTIKANILIRTSVKKGSLPQQDIRKELSRKQYQNESFFSFYGGQ